MKTIKDLNKWRKDIMFMNRKTQKDVNVLRLIDLQKLPHKRSLAQQVFANIQLTFPTTSLRGWKTYISLGGCLTSQLPNVRETMSLPWALTAFLYKAILQTLLNNSAYFSNSALIA